MSGNLRRSLLTVLALVVLVVSAVGVAALAQPDAGDVYTGCLNENSGGLRNVAVGFEPLKKCNKQEMEISWDRAGPAFGALEDRVSDLEGRLDRLDLPVDCDAGDTVGAALAQSQSHVGPVSIIVSGVCEENVQIRRDDVSISGQQRSDGIQAASSTAGAVDVRNARGVVFDNMTISGGTAGIGAEGSAHFQAQNVTVRDTTIWGVWVVGGASALLADCVIIDNEAFGVTADAATARIIRTEFTGNGSGLHATVGGAIQGFDLAVTGNGTGIIASTGGAINLSGSSIESNTEWGVAEWHGGSINVGGDSQIANNGKTGVLVAFNSAFQASETVIENNGQSGISANGSSTVAVGKDVTIHNNASDGISLWDSSYGFANQFATVQISDNAGWGINCAGPAAVKEAQNGFNMGSITFVGNTGGPTNCP